MTAGAGKGCGSDMIILASFCPINEKGLDLAVVTLVKIDIMRGAMMMISAAVDLVGNILLFHGFVLGQSQIR
jgi:hypothetical protein